MNNEEPHRRCWGCSQIDGATIVQAGKASVILRTITLTETAVMDFGERLLCRSCRARLWQIQRRRPPHVRVEPPP